MSHDDLVDSTVMALMRFRQGGFIRLPSDEPEETHYFRRKSSYYWGVNYGYRKRINAGTSGDG